MAILASHDGLEPNTSTVLIGAANLYLPLCTYSSAGRVGWPAFTDGFTAFLGEVKNSAVAVREIRVEGMLHPFGNPIELEFCTLSSQDLSAVSVAGNPPVSFGVWLFPTGTLQIIARYEPKQVDAELIDRISSEKSDLELPFSVAAAWVAAQIDRFLRRSDAHFAFYDQAQIMQMRTIWKVLEPSLGNSAVLGSDDFARAVLTAEGSEFRKGISDLVVDVFPSYPLPISKLRKPKEPRHWADVPSETVDCYVVYHFARIREQRGTSAVIYALSIYYVSYWLSRYFRSLLDDIVFARIASRRTRYPGTTISVMLFARMYVSQSDELSVSMFQELRAVISECYRQWEINEHRKSILEFAERLKEEADAVDAYAQLNRTRLFSLALLVITVAATVSAVPDLIGYVTNPDEGIWLLGSIFVAFLLAAVATIVLSFYWAPRFRKSYRKLETPGDRATEKRRTS